MVWQKRCDGGGSVRIEGAHLGSEEAARGRYLLDSESGCVALIDAVCQRDGLTDIEGRQGEALLSLRVITRSRGAGGQLGTQALALIRECFSGDRALAGVQISEQVPAVTALFDGCDMGERLDRFCAERLGEAELRPWVRYEQGGIRLGLEKTADLRDRVRFSADFDNLLSLTQEQKRPIGRVLVMGEDEDGGELIEAVEREGGIDEVLISGGSVKRRYRRDDESMAVRSDAEYRALLRRLGRARLEEDRDSLRCTVTDGRYRFGADYDLGDLVTLVHPSGRRMGCRVYSGEQITEKGGSVCRVELKPIE